MKRQHDLSPPASTALETAFCTTCGETHARKLTLTVPEFAEIARLSVSTIHTYRSRGLLPRPIGRPGGNPRWTSCVVSQFLHGTLPAELMDTPRKARGGER